MRALTLCARADLQVDRVGLRPIDEMMTISDPSLKPRGVARLQHGRSTIVDQRDLALEDVNELVFGLVPVAQRGGGAGLEAREVDPELGEPDDIAEPVLLSALRYGGPSFGIGGVAARRPPGTAYLRHLSSSPPDG